MGGNGPESTDERGPITRELAEALEYMGFFKAEREEKDSTTPESRSVYAGVHLIGGEVYDANESLKRQFAMPTFALVPSVARESSRDIPMQRKAALIHKALMTIITSVYRENADMFEGCNGLPTGMNASDDASKAVLANKDFYQSQLMARDLLMNLLRLRKGDQVKDLVHCLAHLNLMNHVAVNPSDGSDPVMTQEERTAADSLVQMGLHALAQSCTLLQHGLLQSHFDQEKAVSELRFNVGVAKDTYLLDGQAVDVDEIERVERAKISKIYGVLVRLSLDTKEAIAQELARLESEKKSGESREVRYRAARAIRDINAVLQLDVELPEFPVLAPPARPATEDAEEVSSSEFDIPVFFPPAEGDLEEASDHEFPSPISLYRVDPSGSESDERAEQVFELPPQRRAVPRNTVSPSRPDILDRIVAGLPDPELAEVAADPVVIDAEHVSGEVEHVVPVEQADRTLVPAPQFSGAGDPVQEIKGAMSVLLDIITGDRFGNWMNRRKDLTQPNKPGLIKRILAKLPLPMALKVPELKEIPKELVEILGQDCVDFRNFGLLGGGERLMLEGITWDSGLDLKYHLKLREDIEEIAAVAENVGGLVFEDCHKDVVREVVEQCPNLLYLRIHKIQGTIENWDFLPDSIQTVIVDSCDFEDLKGLLRAKRCEVWFSTGDQLNRKQLKRCVKFDLDSSEDLLKDIAYTMDRAGMDSDGNVEVAVEVQPEGETDDTGAMLRGEGDFWKEEAEEEEGEQDSAGIGPDEIARRVAEVAPELIEETKKEIYQRNGWEHDSPVIKKVIAYMQKLDKAESKEEERGILNQLEHDTALLDRDQISSLRKIASELSANGIYETLPE